MSLRDVVEIADFKCENLFESLDRIKAFCVEHQIRCYPPISEGELDESRYFSLDKDEDTFEEAIDRAIEEGESHTVEFKASSFLDTARLKGGYFDNPEDLISKSVEHEVSKTLSAFLNADGGILLIGVNDDHSIFGIEEEYGFIKGNKKDRDGWELRLSSKLEKCILEYKEVIGHVQQRFVKREDKHIYAMMVSPRKDRIVACFDEESRTEIAYQRAGNRSNRLTPHAIEGLVRQRCANS